jgi:hypothetical protein
MIVFDLKCCSGHTFEAWFRSSGDFDKQVSTHEVECPLCGSTKVSKAIMAPNLRGKANKVDSLDIPIPTHTRDHERLEAPESFEHAPAVIGMPELPADLQDEMESVMLKVQKHVEENCEYVGDDFAEEARKIHYGETSERSIYGETSLDDTEALIEEGIEIMPLPFVRKPGPTDA